MNALAAVNAMEPRVPPHAMDAEQAVLGGLMLDASAADVVAERLAETDFYRREHQAIYRAIMGLTARGEPCDAVTLGDWFERNDVPRMFPNIAQDCCQLAASTPSAANVVAYANIVRDKSQRRQLIGLLTDGMASAWSSSDSTATLIDTAIVALMAMQRTEANAEYTLRQAMTLAYKAAQEAQANGGRIPGIPSGLRDLDRILGGWHDSDLIVIGARPAQGKTALMLNVALAAQVPIGIISAEQPAQQIGARVMSIDAHVPAERLRNGRFEAEDLQRLDTSVHRLVARTCVLYDRSAPTIAEISRVARRWKQQLGIRLLLVDYVQRIEPDATDRRANRAEKVGEVVRGLKNLARDLVIPVIALAQVGRQVDSRPDHQPGMGDLSDSSEIEKEADQVLTLMRPVQYDDEADLADARLSVEKNRHGPTGMVRAAFLAETMRFEDRAYGD